MAGKRWFIVAALLGFSLASAAPALWAGPSAPAAASAALSTVTKTANYSVTAGDVAKHFNNIGAAGEVDFSLPAAAAGLNYCFLVDAAQIVKVVAAAGEKIAVGATNSAAGGNVTANTAYSEICLEAHKAAQWVVRSSTGAWTVN
jgi:hypothetical protein